jgi:hypothetical protein
MEFELDFRKNEETLWLAALIALFIAAIFGLAQIGRNVTPVDAAGNSALLGWPDWQLLKAERVYADEMASLRVDVAELAAMLEREPNPVAAQLLADRITRRTASGDPSLATARIAVSNAALSVRNWASGTLDRDRAILAVQEALAFLK